MNSFDGKNVLCLYYFFPPIKGMGTMRNFKFYRSLRERARKVHVLTTSNREFLESERFNYDFENIHRIKTLDFRTLSNMAGSERSSFIPNEQRQSLSYKLFRLFMDMPAMESFLGTGGYFFYRNAVKKARTIIKEEGIDTIVSSFGPMAAHEVAHKLKKEFPNLNWIADFRDFPKNFREFQENKKKKSDSKKIRALLNNADEVTTVSTGLKNCLEKYHENVSIIRNGFDTSMTLYKLPKDYEYFTLSYTGIIYRRYQKISTIIKALSRLVNSGEISKEKLRLINAGKDGYTWRKELEKEGLTEIFVEKGIVPHTEALEIQRKSHINILLTWAHDEMKGVLTGKLYEYLAAKKPICTLINGVRDRELEYMVEDTGHGQVFYHEEEEITRIAEFIKKKYQLWQAGHSLRVQNTDITQYSWNAQFNNWSRAARRKGISRAI